MCEERGDGNPAARASKKSTKADGNLQIEMQVVNIVLLARTFGSATFSMGEQIASTGRSHLHLAIEWQSSFGTCQPPAASVTTGWRMFTLKLRNVR